MDGSGQTNDVVAACVRILKLMRHVMGDLPPLNVQDLQQAEAWLSTSQRRERNQIISDAFSAFLGQEEGSEDPEVTRVDIVLLGYVCHRPCFPCRITLHAAII